MNAPDIGGVRDVLCHAEMIEQLGLVAIYAGVAELMIDVGDEPGADYALRRMSAHARAVIVARNHLKGDNKTETP